MHRDDAIWSFQAGGYEMPCLQCGTKFVARRADAKFCSSVCRKANSRRKDQMERAAANAIMEIESIRRMSKQYTDLETHAAVQLERIQQALSVTPAGKTDTRASVTLAAVTNNICANCGTITTVSPASRLCLNCLKKMTG